MRINGKWIYIQNHIMENLNKMFYWSKDKEIIEIELGDLNKINNDINYYKDNQMTSYIENNHESNSSYCHFGIYRIYNDELIGYIDFQNRK